MLETLKRLERNSGSFIHSEKCSCFYDHWKWKRRGKTTSKAENNNNYNNNNNNSNNNSVRKRDIFLSSHAEAILQIIFSFFIKLITTNITLC